MKVKKVYQISLVLCGLFLALSGIACLVIATLLNHDSELATSLQSKTRTYGTQYWLGLPIIFYGGLVMVMSPSLHKRRKMAAYGVIVCIPLTACAMVSLILHGAAYAQFNSVHQQRLFLKERRYICSDVLKDATTQCQCVLLGSTKDLFLSVPCTQQQTLVGFHGALLTFSALAFAMLLGILTIAGVFMLHFFKIEFPRSTSGSGEDNEGFSHAGDRRRSADVHMDTPLSHHPSQITLNGPLDSPPSYESLIPLFDMSRGMTSHASASPDTIVTHDVTERNRTATLSGPTATVNGQARVRYRGETSSRFINQIAGRAESAGESSPNANSINELENVAEQIAVVNNTPTSSSEPVLLRISHIRPHEVNSTSRSDPRENTSNELDLVTHQDIEARADEATLNDINEPRSEQYSVPDTEIRSEPASPPSGEAIPLERNNSSDRSLSFTTSNSTEVNMRVLRHSSLRNAHLSSIDYSNDMHVAACEENNPIDQSVRNSSTMEHAPLERTMSDNSEDGVYIDISQTSGQTSVSNTDPTSISVTYGDQLDSNQACSHITNEQEDISDENLQERTTDEDHTSSNEFISTESSDQTADSLNNDTDGTATVGDPPDNDTDEAVILDTDCPCEVEIRDETPSHQDGQSVSSKRDDINPQNSDTSSVSSLEIMSI